MRPVYLNNAAPPSGRIAPWHLKVYLGRPVDHELTRGQVFVRDVVEGAASITRRGTMYDYLRGQRAYPMSDLQTRDPRMCRFVRTELDPVNALKKDWDLFAHYVASLPLRYVQILSKGNVATPERGSKLVNNTIGGMSVFPLHTVFKSFALMSLYFYQEFDPRLCTAFEQADPVHMSSAFAGLAREQVNNSRFELIAAAMLIASGDGYLAAARKVPKDEYMQKSHAMRALRSFGLATLVSLGVKPNAHCFSADILSVVQEYAAYMQFAISKWQKRTKAK